MAKIENVDFVGRGDMAKKTQTNANSLNNLRPFKKGENPRTRVGAKSLANLKPFKKGNPDGRAGRKVGSRSKWDIISEQARQDLARRIGITPLEFLLSLLRDEKTPILFKIRAATECAPYMHKRMPIAIEGGDKPLTVLDPASLAKLSTKELAALSLIMEKLGVTGKLVNEETTP